MIRARPAHPGAFCWGLLATLATLVLAGSAAIAAPKPKIAVLGLEVQSSTVDQQDAEIAKALTVELRARARQATGPFQLAPGGERELIDEKVMNNCTAEAVGCMVSIGTAIPSDELMFGKIERDGADAYKITIKLLNVNTKTTSLWGPERLTEKLAKTPALKELADRAYDTLVGVSSDGTLVVKASIQGGGKVFINDVEKGEIKSGTFIATLPENRYRVAIEAKGYRRWELADVTIRGGKTESVNADLVSLEMGHTRGGIESDENHHTGLKVAGAISLGVAAVAGGLWIYEYTQQNHYAGLEEGKGAFKDTDPMGDQLDSDGCKFADHAVGDGAEDFRSACDAKSAQHVTIPLTIAGGIAGITFIVLSTRGGNEHASRSAQRARKKQRQFAVTPIVSPTSGGATVRFDW